MTKDHGSLGVWDKDRIPAGVEVTNTGEIEMEKEELQALLQGVVSDALQGINQKIDGVVTRMDSLEQRDKARADAEDRRKKRPEKRPKPMKPQRNSVKLMKLRQRRRKKKPKLTRQQPKTLRRKQRLIPKRKNSVRLTRRQKKNAMTLPWQKRRQKPTPHSVPAVKTRQHRFLVKMRWTTASVR